MSGNANSGGTLGDRELARLYLDDRSDPEVQRELFGRCVEKIRVAVTASRIVPEFLIDDAVSLAQECLLQGIERLRSPENLNGWLVQVSRNSAISVRRRHFGRGGNQRTYAPLEPREGTDAVTSLLENQQTHDAVQKHLYNSRFWHDPEHCIAEREIRDLIESAFLVHAEGSKRDIDCTIWMKAQLREELSIEEIARRRGTTKDDVWHLFGHNQQMLRQILVERFRVELKDLPL